MKRVVITGVGAVTPIGNNAQDFWKSIREGVCGVDVITRFDPEKYACRIGAEVKDFDPLQFIDKKEVRHMDRYAQYALAAAKMAVEDSKLDPAALDPFRAGVITGSGIGGIETAEKQIMVNETKGPGRVSPFYITMMISNMAASYIALEYGLKGPNYNVVSACASGTNAIGEAFRLVRDGTCDVMVAGGAEAPITPSSFAGFCSMKAMSTRNDDPKGASCPFDKDRDGFVMGEGSGMVVLEEYEHAKARGAEILCELAGYGATDDAYHITMPDPTGEGGRKAMEFAIRDAGVEPKDITYINAHGTSTPYNDKFETAAIRTLFGDDAKKVAVSSTKSMTGHLLGAAGGIEAVICALAIRDSYIPATINYKTPDEECDLDYVVNEGRNQEVAYAMSNSLGFGGHNAALVFKKCD